MGLRMANKRFIGACANCYNEMTLVEPINLKSRRLCPSFSHSHVVRATSVTRTRTHHLPPFSPLRFRTSWVPIAMLTTNSVRIHSGIRARLLFGCQREFATVFCSRILETRRISLRLLHEDELWVSAIWGYVLFRFDGRVGGPPVIYVTRRTHVRLSLNRFAWSVWRVLRLFLGSWCRWRPIWDVMFLGFVTFDHLIMDIG